jgi:hypothetical protein
VLATMHEAVREWAYNVGGQFPLRQWLLSDYDTWERNPGYIGPDLGHPEYDTPLGTVFATLAEAKREAISMAKHLGRPLRVEHYQSRCWVVWY